MCVFFQRYLSLMCIPPEKIRFRIENRQTHPAANIHSDSIRYNCIIHSQHTADRQSITGMCIGHQRTRQCYRQTHCQFHLLLGSGFYKFIAVNLIAQRQLFQFIDLKISFCNGRREAFCQFSPHITILMVLRIIKYIRQLRQNLFFTFVLAIFAYNSNSQTTRHIIGIS